MLTSCWNTKWTEKERKEFSEKCSKEIYVDVGSICFTGFEFTQIDKAKVIEKNKEKVLDTFLINIYTQRDDHDKKHKRYWGYIDSMLNVNNTYSFFLGEEIPYVLHDMKKTLSAQYTMGGEGWGCSMSNFTIDDEKFESKGNICIMKRGFEYE